MVDFSVCAHKSVQLRICGLVVSCILIGVLYNLNQWKQTSLQFASTSKGTNTRPAEENLQLYPKNEKLQQVLNSIYMTFVSIQRGENLFLLRTGTIPSFIQVVPSPLLFPLEPRVLMEVGVLAPHFTTLFRSLLEQQCQNDPATLFVDVGAGFAYFSLYSAALGCRAICFEPNPLLSTPIRQSIGFNGFEDRISFHPVLISDLNENLEFNYQEEDIENANILAAKASQPMNDFLSPHNVIKNQEGNSDNDQETPLMQAYKVDQFVREDIFIMRIDVNGYELKVLDSVGDLLRTRNVQHIFVNWEEGKKNIEASSLRLKFLEHLGYEIYSLPLERENLPIVDWNDIYWKNSAIRLDSSQFDQPTAFNQWIWIRKPASSETTPTSPAT